MKIIPVNKVGPSRTGNLEGITFAEIVQILGFTPNCQDDTDKVKYSWGFEIDGKPFGIWDYKGSHRYNTWSTYGDSKVLSKLFGYKYTS